MAATTKTATALTTTLLTVAEKGNEKKRQTSYKSIYIYLVYIYICTSIQLCLTTEEKAKAKQVKQDKIFNEQSWQVV